LTPPDLLYHGTATRFLSSVFGQGLLPQARRYVHLSVDEPTAVSVGQRHGKPVVLTVRAGQMYDNGFTFYRSDSGIWLTERVPAEYISL